MEKYINKIIHDDFLNNILPDKCAKLIIADPPYFEVKGEFDFIWKSFEDYLKDVEKWAVECKRILADNGTLFWWGHAKKIAYSQIILDKYFNLENSMIWRKIDSMQYQYYSIELSRSFNTHNERVLMYSNEIIKTGLEEIKLDINNFKTLRNYFEKLQKYINVEKKDILKKIGSSADHCFRWGSSQWDLPTIETYNELIKYFNINKMQGFREYEELRQEYEELRQEYEELRRPFNNELKLEDVLTFSQESNISRKYKHDTIKPETLTRALINACSNEGDLVVIPFAGSGTECSMSAKDGRPFIAFEKEIKHVETSRERVKEYLEQGVLF